ncbi:MAG: hypothetical protein M3016_00920 [Actinomycetota bacterium]|nr:hypothetical protein [Actinomycetota bacterium]
MGTSGPRATAGELGLLAALLAWGAYPIILLLAQASHTHTSLTGANGLIGVDGVLGADQLQYLAWARDAGSHGLASDLFSLPPSAHVYLEPLFTITGALWRLGLPLPVAYLLWTPVAAVVLWLAGLAWARRAFPNQLGARAATVVLAVFLSTPLAALFSWTGTGAGPFRFQLYLLGDELLGAGKLWGYVPSAIALALMPLALLSVERALDPDRGSRPGRRALRRRVERRPLVAATAAALLAAWLHPWQGITLIVVLVALAVWQRRDGGAAVLLPLLGAALPLGYYYLLGHGDPAWELASHYESTSRLGALVLLAGFGPLIALGALGLRRPGGIVFEQVLVLWILGGLVTYFVNDAYPPHALQGLSFPLAVLAVRGGQRLRMPVALAALGLLLFTVPGLAYSARKFARTASDRHVQYYLPRDDQRALAWIDRRGPPGGVLAPTPIAIVVPSQTGRAVWVGHGSWSRDYARRVRQVDALFNGRITAAKARSFVLGTGTSILFADCAHPRYLRRILMALPASVHHFGCARVYTLARGRSAVR